jgi:hypothetical protein
VALSANALYGQEDRVGYYSECRPGGANSDGQYSEAGPGRASGTYYDALDTPDYAMSNAEDPAYGAMQNPGEYNMFFSLAHHLNHVRIQPACLNIASVCRRLSFAEHSLSTAFRNTSYDLKHLYDVCHALCNTAFDACMVRVFAATPDSAYGVMCSLVQTTTAHPTPPATQTTTVRPTLPATPAMTAGQTHLQHTAP